MQTFYADRSSVFWKVQEEFGGLSNMSSSFPIRVTGIDEPIWHSEGLYQACRFPSDPDLQREILREKNPMRAKMMTKPHRDRTRPDWEQGTLEHDQARILAMRWSIQLKLMCNPVTFGDLLMSTGFNTIVEKSTKDQFWGAFEQKDGTLLGQNILGWLLTDLREELRNHGAPSKVEPPNLPDFKLLGKVIGTCT